jgi:hypothetical protein
MDRSPCLIADQTKWTLLTYEVKCPCLQRMCGACFLRRNTDPALCAALNVEIKNYSISVSRLRLYVDTQLLLDPHFCSQVTCRACSAAQHGPCPHARPTQQKPHRKQVSQYLPFHCMDSTYRTTATIPTKFPNRRIVSMLHLRNVNQNLFDMRYPSLSIS